MHRPTTVPPCLVNVLQSDLGSLDRLTTLILEIDCHFFFEVDFLGIMRLPALRTYYSTVLQHRICSTSYRRLVARSVIHSAAIQRRRLNSSFAVDRPSQRDDSILFGQSTPASSSQGELQLYS